MYNLYDEKNERFLKGNSNMTWIAIIISVLVLDRITKYLVVKNIPFDTTVPVIDRFFYLTYWRNKGAAWGILQNGRYFFIVLTIVVLIMLFFVLYRSKDIMLKISISLIIGGAIGNLIDRLSPGSVVDFLSFYFGSYHFPVFNVSDSFVVIGTIILAIYLLFVHKERGQTC